MATIHGWFRPIRETQLVTLRSRLYELPLHFVQTGQSAGEVEIFKRPQHVRCLRAGCGLCSFYPTKEHNAAVVQWEGGGMFRLLEFTEHHAELTNQLDLLGPRIIGQQLRVARIERACGVELCYELAGAVEVKEILAQKYVASIGMRAYATCADALGI